jgi:hypothetical protein
VEIFAAQGAPPTANEKKSSIRKVFIISFGHLWVVVLELAYRYIFSFKFTLSCQQSDIVPIIDTGGNLPPVLLTLVKNLPPVSTTPAELVAKFVAGVVDTGGAP